METRSFRRVEVFDGVLRGLHAWNGLLIVTLVAMGWLQKSLPAGVAHIVLTDWHITLGKALIVGLCARFIWGIVGFRHARWRAFWQPKAWAAGLRGHSPPVPGHDPRASLVYLALYAVLFVVSASGLALAGLAHNRGPLAEALFDRVAPFYDLAMVHDLGLYAVTTFIVVHLIALALHERRHGYPVAQAMISGFQYLPRDDREGPHA